MHPESNKNDGIPVDILRVAPDYFQTMGIPLLRGRDFISSEGVEGSGVAIINEALAKRLRKNQDPLGQRMTFFGEESRSKVIRVDPPREQRKPPEDLVCLLFLTQITSVPDSSALNSTV